MWAKKGKNSEIKLVCWLHDYLYKESEAENSPHQYFNIKTSAEVVNDVVIGIRVQIANSFKTFS